MLHITRRDLAKLKRMGVQVKETTHPISAELLKEISPKKEHVSTPLEDFPIGRTIVIRESDGKERAKDN